MELNISIPSCEQHCSRCPLNLAYKFGDDLSFSHIDQMINIDNKRIKFSNRAFRVLCALLRENNTPVSFNHLQNYGWPDSSVVKNNLTVVISEIRTNLRHSAVDIENIRGYGYMLTIPQAHLTYGVANA